jgi:hypothetical protein
VIEYKTVFSIPCIGTPNADGKVSKQRFGAEARPAQKRWAKPVSAVVLFSFS